ncbi:MAG TPA: hypothetical protein VK849_13930, partial [Longimicrobiales bacterium]|nr:hypothetical protein [Longimicrobiales bacterium]
MYRTGKGVGLGGSGAGVGARAVARWRGKALVAAFALLGGLPAVPGAAVLVSQEGPSPAVRETVSRVLEIFESRGREPLDRFAWDVLAPAYRATFDGDALVQRLEAVREAGRGRTSDVEVRRRADGGLDLVLADGVRFIVELDEDARIVRLETAPPAAGFEGDAPDGAAPELASWEGLGAWLEAETARGFSGVVLARRAGEVVLRRAYGPADRSSGRPVELESAFGIGSTP